MKIVWGRSIGWNIELQGYKKRKMEYSIIENGCDCYPWTKFFAWLPVTTITGQRAWGVRLYRRKVWVVWGTGFHMEPTVQYATLFELIEHGNIKTVSVA